MARGSGGKALIIIAVIAAASIGYFGFTASGKANWQKIKDKLGGLGGGGSYSKKEAELMMRRYGIEVAGWSDEEQKKLLDMYGIKPSSSSDNNDIEGEEV